MHDILSYKNYHCLQKIDKRIYLDFVHLYFLLILYIKHLFILFIYCSDSL